MTTKSTYTIHYWPRNKIAGFGVTIKISNEFLEFAKRQKIDKQKYEEIGLEIIQASGWKNLNYDFFEKTGGICNWVEGVENTGLLHHVRVPGNAAGVALEKGLDGWAYYPHNMDNISQASAVLGIMSHYLDNIESRMPKDEE